jgi:hypothetical protein
MFVGRWQRLWILESSEMRRELIQFPDQRLLLSLFAQLQTP